MTINTILVYLDTSPDTEDRLVLAHRLARKFDAFLIGAGLEEAAAAAERFASILRQEQLRGEFRMIRAAAAPYLTRHACAADLVIVGQYNPEHATGLDEPGEVILGCGRPVLVLPHGLPIRWVDKHVLIAWNNSREARRAVHDAMPLIAIAGVVSVVTIDPAEDDKETAAELLAYLNRHGLYPDPKSIDSGILTVTDALLGHAKRMGADVVVMGAYGHSRLSETVLGGVTHDMLRDMIRPVLMSH